MSHRIVDATRVPRPKTGPYAKHCWLCGPDDGTKRVLIHCNRPIGHDQGVGKTPHSWERDND
jgi:hypothetical protein